MLTLYKHTLVPDLPGLEQYIGNPYSVVDVGAGLRPATWAKAKRHVCVEPCRVYADALRENGYEVIEKDATSWARGFTGSCDLVLMLDVIEHMDSQAGQAAIIEAFLVRPDRVIIYTPNGFVPQNEDAWGTGQHEWQRHRSGWTPDMFDGWTIIEGNEGFAAISR